MLCVRNLSKSFKNGTTSFKALNDITVEVNKSEIFGFIGLSGAGKTSLVRCIAMLEKADSGEIILDGSDLTKLKPSELRETRKKLGLVFQHFHLLMNSTVYENIAFPLVLSKKPKEYIDKKVNELIELVGLTDKKDAYPSKLSGGQKQRVGIARALAGDPEVVLCDEATSALDPLTTKSILKLIKKINREFGVTFIIITHEMDVIKEICDRVAIMEGGEIIEAGNVTDILVAPKTQTAKHFFTKDTEFAPENYRSELARGDRLILATFVGEKALKPFISDVIRKFDVELSILEGNIETVGSTIIGRLLLRMSGTPEALSASIKYFIDGEVRIEERDV